MAGRATTLSELAERVVLRHLERRSMGTTLEEIRFDVVDEIGRNEPDPKAREEMIEAAVKLLQAPQRAS